MPMRDVRGGLPPPVLSFGKSDRPACHVRPLTIVGARPQFIKTAALCLPRHCKRHTMMLYCVLRYGSF